MSSTDISAASIEILKKVSVATLATALYKRGLRNQVIQDVVPLAGTMAKICSARLAGGSCYLRYMPAREDRNTPAELRTRNTRSASPLNNARQVTCL